MATIWLSGLSGSQAEHLVSNYPAFAKFGDQKNMPGEKCVAYRMVEPAAIPVDALTHNGQYAPISQLEKSGALTVTGFNFKAVVAAPQDETLSLGVALEEELPQPNVFENFLRVFAAHRVLQEGGMLLHSAGIVVDGKAYIYCGRSNVGKTTLTRKAFAEGNGVLSDDINMLMPDDRGTYRAFAVPFTGEFGRTLHSVQKLNSYPVAGVFLLQQGESLQLEAVTPSIALAQLLVSSPFVNTDENNSEMLMQNLNEMVSRIKIMRLVKSLNVSFADVFNATSVAKGVTNS